MSKTVVITGAAKGIGRAIARSFAYSGYNVCINYNTSEVEAKALCEELAKDGCNVIICKADVTVRQQVDKWGNVDDIVFFFNFDGVIQPLRPEEIKVKEEEGVFYLTKA